jgi:uncharacterized membrane protein YeaQ/YmgE (transglycosylase-associated protein family)
LQEAAQEVFAYLQGSVIVSLVVAFVAGFAAAKTVAYERRYGAVVFLIIGILGLFLGEFVLVYFRLDQYLEGIAEFRLLIDVIAAYLGAFFFAALVHFIKPT